MKKFLTKIILFFNNNYLAKPTFILALVVFLAAFILSHVKEITYPSILRQTEEKEKLALNLVLPGYHSLLKRRVEIEGKDFIFWEGEKKDLNKESKGYAFISFEPGYSGPVKSMVGFNDQGKILGIYILEQTETPGLGARCLEVASSQLFWTSFFKAKKKNLNHSRPWFQEQFKGLDLTKGIKILQKGDWNQSLRKELLQVNGITSLTGATITSKAVTKSLQAGFKVLKEKINLTIPAVQNLDNNFLEDDENINREREEE
jgi:electron transport complex protein RnfG